MKTFLIVLAVLTFLIVATPEANALFGHVKAEKTRQQETQQRLVHEQQRMLEQQRLTTQQQQLTSRWQTTAFVLGTTSVITLIIGTAIGSRGRRDATK